MKLSFWCVAQPWGFQTQGWVMMCISSPALLALCLLLLEFPLFSMPASLWYHTYYCLILLISLGRSLFSSGVPIAFEKTNHVSEIIIPELISPVYQSSWCQSAACTCSIIHIACLRLWDGKYSNLSGEYFISCYPLFSTLHESKDYQGEGWKQMKVNNDELSSSKQRQVMNSNHFHLS